MKPVHQTKFHPDPVNGNSFEACVASLLEVPLDQLPQFDKDSTHWFRDLLFFVDQQGYTLALSRYRKMPKQGIYIMTGIDPRNPFIRSCSHCVVVQDGKMVHDPHPSNNGLIKGVGWWTMKKK